MSEFCGGNVARFERMKLLHGVRVVYMWAAERVGKRWFRPELLVELYRRVPKPPKHLRDWAMREDGYIIDAPDTMPAGGCVAYYLPDMTDVPEDERYMAVQLTVERE